MVFSLRCGFGRSKWYRATGLTVSVVAMVTTSLLSSKSHLLIVRDERQRVGFRPLRCGCHGIGVEFFGDGAVILCHPHDLSMLIEDNLPAAAGGDVVLDTLGDRLAHMCAA